MEALPSAQLVWVDACGHCAHLEQPQALLDAVVGFCGLTAGVAADPEVASSPA